MSFQHGGPAALFLAPSTAEPTEQVRIRRDASDEAMHRLRHPFDVAADDVTCGAPARERR